MVADAREFSQFVLLEAWCVHYYCIHLFTEISGTRP